MGNRCADAQPNWWRSDPTSFSPLPAPPLLRCWKRHAPCRLCSPVSPIRSGLAMSRVWRSRAATHIPSPQNGWSWASTADATRKYAAELVALAAVRILPSRLESTRRLPCFALAPEQPFSFLLRGGGIAMSFGKFQGEVIAKWSRDPPLEARNMSLMADFSYIEPTRPPTVWPAAKGRCIDG